MNKDYNAGMRQGRIEEQESILMMLETFYELTQEPDDEGKVTDNPEWDNGFQSAIALIKNTRISHDEICFRTEGKFEGGCSCKSAH